MYSKNMEKCIYFPYSFPPQGQEQIILSVNEKKKEEEEKSFWILKQLL